MNQNQFQEEIVPILVLTIIVCISVIALSIINSLTEGPIEDAEKEKIEELLKEQFPELDSYKEDTPATDVFTVYSETGSIIGYAFNIDANGYSSDPIKILVAIENTTLAEDDIILRGISIISNTETPGLGAKVTEDSFLEPFVSINLNDVYLRDDGGKIDAISGATISSSAVVDAIQKDTRSRVTQILDAQEGED